MRIAGIILIVIGLIGFAFQGITYTRRQETMRVGPISASVQEKETIPIPPILAGIAVIAGAALLFVGRRKA